MTEKFVLIAKMRSGTHFFKSVIGGHPDIHCYPEVLPGLGPEQFHSFWLRKIREDEKNILPYNRPGIFDDYLTCVFASLPGKKAVGLDIKGVPNTYWAAYNCVTEFVSHLRTRNSDARLDSMISGASAQMLERALNLGLQAADTGLPQAAIN